ncbi:Hypothetical predicted protein [Podarcis lilfordi]|uniref:Uncharacterized protein n=1 Tax=Podarcis lilfordi TaxID=74358 RepID=A0AA35LNF5_9SAUR|nr:Hypothetical predicted protein [Podarcis lilfordi]
MHEETVDALAFMEIKHKELNLRFRGVIEQEGENIKERLIMEIANWLGLDEEEVGKTIDKAFRIKYKTERGKKNLPGDCLVFLNSREMKDLILRTNLERKLCINEKIIIIYKETPKRFLKRREEYKDITLILRKNEIWYKWEFPEGVSFFYKDKKFKIKSTQEIVKFMRRYGKELGKKEDDTPLEEEEEKEI